VDTATHCNTLQHAATRCNTLQHTATHCNTGASVTARGQVWKGILQHTTSRSATHCNATHYNSLQHTATYCNTLQHRRKYDSWRTSVKGHISTHCITHCNTLHCNTLQLTATHCNTLQRTTTHRITGERVTARGEVWKGTNTGINKKKIKESYIPMTRHVQKTNTYT